jgi:thiol:disulfide interchange protein DsbD
MVTAERVLGFVLSATVLYLLWILTKQTEPDRVWPALGFLTLMAGALVWADHARSSRPARVLALGFLALLIGGFFFLTVPPPSPSPAAEPAASERPKAGWTPFSQEILQTSLAAGKPVFVDATAAWCATCQVNEAAVLDRPDVAALFERLGIVRLRADDTLPNPLIRSWLASVERAGLPVYALYRPGKVPLLFPELLTDDNLTRRLPGLMER